MIEFVVLKGNKLIQNIQSGFMTEFILASKSPRRQMLLRNVISHFLVVETDISEAANSGEQPAEYVIRVATEKALTAGKRIEQTRLPDVVVIAADTIVVDNDEILGKPTSPKDAKRILDQLRGKTHQVFSGIAIFILESNKIFSRMIYTDVTMREYSGKEINEYINSGDPLDKAGAYGIQNELFNPAPDFNGCFANVMGLPLCHLSLLLRDAELASNKKVAERCQKAINYQCPVYSGILSRKNGI